MCESAISSLWDRLASCPAYPRILCSAARGGKDRQQVVRHWLAQKINSRRPEELGFFYRNKQTKQNPYQVSEYNAH